MTYGSSNYWSRSTCFMGVSFGINLCYIIGYYSKIISVEYPYIAIEGTNDIVVF